VSIGDAIRRLIDPIHPAVRDWLRAELPRLVADGYLEAAQADLIARRYGVRLDPESLGLPPAEVDDADEADERPGAAAATLEASIAEGEAPATAQPGPPAGSAAPPTGGAAPGAPAAPVEAPVTPAARATAATARPGGSPFLADHAVSIVLYLGAFLVVAAVVIFLAYSWGDISGGAKLTVLALLTAGFLGAAWLCLPRPAVRPAGRTFLALGAILVPANVAAVYVVYFADGPIPGAVFWLLGALISGGLHAALSVRLGSHAYGALATLAVPVAAGALSWLVEPDEAWLGTAAAVGLAGTLAVARRGPPIPLVQSARWVAAGLLPIAFLASLISIEESGRRQLAAPIALALMSAGLAWEALRGDKTWWIGAAAGLLTAPFIALAIGLQENRPWFVAAVVFASWVASLPGRRLDARRATAWDLAAIGPALLYPLAAWGDDRACLTLFASLALLSGFLAWSRRSPLPLYAAVIAVDGVYVKLLDIYGSPDSPRWALGVALWPLGMLWTAVGASVPRRLLPFGGPCWLGALLTLLPALALTWSQPSWSAGVAASGAVATAVAAWRFGLGPLLLAGPWLMLAGYQGADALRLELPWRFVAAGLTGWLLFVISLLPEPESALTAGTGPPAGAPTRAGLPFRPPAALAWSLSARLAAAGVAGLAALLLTLGFGSGDAWLVAGMVGWLDLALVLAAWAALTRSRDLALTAALSLVPALAMGIARLHPADNQAYAVPIGLYLLGLAAVTRRDRRPGRPQAATAIGTLGLVVLLGTGVAQSLDTQRFDYTLLTLAESLVLLGLGIAVRWRVLVVGGVAGTVVIAVRQLFDAVAALPGWAILGGSGLLLLGIAVALLLARARLAAAGRSVAERWSSWD
jgi:hypothetical protein